MRIEQLAYVAAVTELGSLRRAAEHLHVSQPAMSEAVAKLERELGVTLLERHRSGARVSEAGAALLPHVVEVLEAVERLRATADDRSVTIRTLRVGSVNAGTSTLLLPALRRLREVRPDIPVEVRTLQQHEISTGLLEGTLDLGLVNLLSGDDVSPDLAGRVLLRGRPVAVLPAGHPLAQADEVSVDDLRAEPFIGMRAGYVMHRFAHRLFGSQRPAAWHTVDGAEMGKLMVTEGLGVTLLPDFSVSGDPLERAGLIQARRIVGDATAVRLAVLQRRRDRVPEADRSLIEALEHQARARGQASG